MKTGRKVAGSYSDTAAGNSLEIAEDCIGRKDLQQ